MAFRAQAHLWLTVEQPREAPIMTDIIETKSDPEPSSRWQLTRDVIAFQFKLMLDSGRDFILSPVSIGAAILGVFTSRDDPGKYFYRLLSFGHNTDRWINLFNTYSVEDTTEPSADRVVQHAEELLRTEYEKGGVVRHIKDQTDNVIDQFQKRKGNDSKEL